MHNSSMECLYVFVVHIQLLCEIMCKIYMACLVEGVPYLKYPPDKIFNIFHSGEHIKSNYNAGMLVLRPNLCVSNNFVHKVAVIV